MRKYSIVPILIVLLSGCASLGLAPASSFDERLAYAVSQNAAVRQAAANSLKAGDIDKADAQNVLELTDQSRAILDAARVASGLGDLKTAEARLSLASVILVKLQSYLRERSKS
jgi:hypothetical protein